MNITMLQQDLLIMSPKSIAKKYGVHIATVYKTIKKYGLEKNPNFSNRINPKYETYLNDRKYMIMMLQKYTQKQIAKKFETTQETISKRIKKHGINKNDYNTHQILLNDIEWLKQELVTKTDKMIANDLGIDHTTVSKYRNKHKLSSHNQQLKHPISKDLLIDLYITQKMTISQIAAHISKSESTVSKYLNDYEIPTRISKTHNCLTKQWLQEKLQNHYNVKEMAEELGVSQTNIKNHLNKHGLKTKLNHYQVKRSIRNCLNNKEWLRQQYKTKTSREISKDLGCSYNTVQNALYNFGIEVSRKPQSSYERDVLSHFEKDYTVQTNNRNLIPNSNTEADLYFPEHKLVIELDGAYWHSVKPKKYHQDKKLAFVSHGYTCVQIWDFEWDNKQDIVLSMINNKLNKHTKVLRASKCEVRTLTNCSKFLRDNHIQGDCPASIKLGLFYENELVSVMTFGKPRFNKHHDYELIRFCVKKNHKIHGAAGKLFKHFKENYNFTSIVSYCNLRYGTGNLYQSLGFVYSHTTEPSYFWVHKTDSNNKLSRYQTQKHNLSKILGSGFAPNMSEKENMENNGYLRLYDSGNLVYIYS